MPISRLVHRLTALLVAISATTGRAGDELAELRARLDAVEQQNAMLLERLERAEAVNERQAGIVPAGASLNEPPCLNPMGCAPGDGGGAPARAAGSADDPLTMTVIWSHGLEAHTKDKRFRVHIGGRTQVDAIWLENDTAAFAGAGGAGDDDAVDIRRARVKVDGTMFGIIDWAFQCDFVNADNINRPAASSEANVSNVPAPTDVWVNIKDIPWVGNLRVGNYKEPIGFEHLISSRYLDFLERSFNQDAFTGPFNNGFSPGVGFWNTFLEERGTWATGVFKNTTNAFAWDPGDGEYAWTSRVTFLPIYDEESQGGNLFHLGLSGSIRDPNNGLYQVRSRGSLRNGPGPLNPVLVNSGAFRSDTTYLLGAEAVGQWGPLLLQAEYIANWNSDSIGNSITSVLGAPLGTVFFYGWYADALVFLTGEHREYEKKNGAFGRVIPHENFDWNGGLGAWQLGVRYAELNLQDVGIDGGMVHDVTVGLNWFLNPNMKLQSNYVYTMRDAAGPPAGGNYSGFGMRLAYDF